MTDRVFYPAQEQTLKKAIHALRQIKELLGGGGAVPDGAVTTSKLADNAVTMGKLSQDVQDAIEEGGSGYNPSLSVGRADALTGADETAQWATRESTGSGTATVRSVQGAAVVWNQLYTNDAASKTQNGVTFTNNGDGSWTIEGVPSSYTRYQITTRNDLFPSGHKILLSMHPSRADVNVFLMLSQQGVDTLYVSAAAGSDIKTVANPTGNQLSIRIDSAYGGETITITPQCFDLTQMFGAGNEPSTVAEFERMYPEAYYPYSAPTLKPVTIAGIASTDAQGGELDSVEWEAFTLRGAGTIGDMLYSDHVETRVGVVDLGTLTYTRSTSGLFQTTGLQGLAYGPLGSSVANVSSALYTAVTSNSITGPDGTNPSPNMVMAIAASGIAYFNNTSYTDAATFKAAMSGVYLFYELATPTTTPISPALPMTYKVQAGGSESIIVPDGEVSAAPVLTIAEGESAAELVMDALACIATPDGPTATANHSVGTYLTMGGKLYKVTSAIAVGETITPNTNVTETTVMAELIARTA